MRKKFAPAAVAAALLALAIALAGCSSGPSDEEVIRQGVSEELAAIKGRATTSSSAPSRRTPGRTSRPLASTPATS